MWTLENTAEWVHNFESFESGIQATIVDTLNSSFSPDVVKAQLEMRKRAIENLTSAQNVLNEGKQSYPTAVQSCDVVGNVDDLKGCAIVFTAGGDGERLRLSLEEQGVDKNKLADFTKATYELPEFYKDFGALHVNLSVVAQICKQIGFDIPVVVTTGPEGSNTARVIPEVLDKYNNFGLKNVIVVKQDARVHFTQEDKIACKFVDGNIQLITHPDETGGPLMKLRAPYDGDASVLDILVDCGCSKLVILQGTAVYNTDVIYNIATVAKNYDGVGVGIARTSFPESDPYGTFVAVNGGGGEKVCILEKEVRNAETHSLADESGSFYLPYNTGFYAFNIDVLKDKALPDYATPPKEVLSGLAKSPKVGYAATDLLPLAEKTAVITIPADSYSTIKNSDDLPRMTEVAKLFNLQAACEAVC